MYLCTAEWDHYKIDNDWLVERMKKCCPNKLLGYYVEPKMNHGEIPHDEISKIFAHYLSTTRKSTNDDADFMAAKK